MGGEKVRRRMFPNLEAEMARKGLKGKDLAEILGVRVATVYDKLNGKYPFSLDEAMKIKRTFFPEYSIEYLFSKEIEVA